MPHDEQDPVTNKTDNPQRDISDNPETDAAVDDISAKESDKLLEAEDNFRKNVNEKPKGLGGKLGDFFSAWLGNKKGRHWTYLAVFFIICGLVAIPSIRYWGLNLYGARSSLSLTTIDGNTDLPLNNVTVSVSGRTVKSNLTGSVNITQIKLGKQTLSLSRPGYATIKQNLIIGWGGNPLGTYDLKEVGQQYTIKVSDYLSGQPVTNSQADSNGLNALSDKNGKITLTVTNPNNQPVPVTISAPGYKSANIDLTSTSTNVQLVSSTKDVFISDQNGSYDLYSCYVDGSGRQLLLPGTATENASISLLVSPDNTQVAMVSTRDGKVDTNGNLEDSLTMVNTGNGNNTTLDVAEQIQLLGWSGTTIVYLEESPPNPTSTYSIISYNYATNSRNQLATSDSQFVSAMIAGKYLYYSPSLSANSATNGFYSEQVNGSNNQEVINQVIQTVVRSSYNSLYVQAGNGWYNYNLSSNSAEVSSAPQNYSNRLYIDSPDGKNSAWVNSTDSGAQLLVYNLSANIDSTVPTDNEVNYPMHWLNADDLIYRETNVNGSSDYIVNISHGQPKKITDVMNISGVTGGL